MRLMSSRAIVQLTDDMRAALRFVKEGHVRLGVEENIICPRTVDVLALRELYAQGLWDWTIRLPGGRGKLTAIGKGALET